MYIRDYMKSPVITVTSNTLLHDAQKIMQEYDIRRLPVVDKGKLVGLITQDGIREAGPSSATSLSVWELDYLLAKMKVKDIMVKDVITFSPDTAIEEAWVTGHKNNIGTFPVVEKGKLVGIMTTTDIYRQMMHILGFGEKGTRLFLPDCKKEMQPDVMGILSKHKAEVLSIFPVTPPGAQQTNFIIHLATDDVRPIVDDIKKLGCEVEIREH